MCIIFLTWRHRCLTARNVIPRLAADETQLLGFSTPWSFSSRAGRPLTFALNFIYNKLCRNKTVSYTYRRRRRFQSAAQTISAPERKIPGGGIKFNNWWRRTKGRFFFPNGNPRLRPQKIIFLFHIAAELMWQVGEQRNWRQNLPERDNNREKRDLCVSDVS